MEMITTSKAGTLRRAKLGLALFHLRREGANFSPVIHHPICHSIPSTSTTILFDMRTEHLIPFMTITRLEVLKGVRITSQQESPISTTATPRTTIRVVLPPSITPSHVKRILHTLRNYHLETDTFFATNALKTTKTAKFLNTFCNAQSISTYWKFCSEILVLSPGKLLIESNATKKVWMEAMALDHGEDPNRAAKNLRHRNSHNNGQMIACTPTTQNNARAIRNHIKGIPNNPATTVLIEGDPGHDETALLTRITDHALTTQNLPYTAAKDREHPRTGEYVIRHPDEDQPGAITIMCADPTQSQHIYRAFHGKAMKVGEEWIHLTVSGDCLDGNPELTACPTDPSGGSGDY